jgi:hypothetical protein
MNENKTIEFLENLVGASVMLCIEFCNAAYISHRVDPRKNSYDFLGIFSKG